MRVRDGVLLRILHLSPAKECVLCGAVERLELHHVVPRGAPNFGDDVRENLVFLCSEQHRRITVNEIKTRRHLGEYLVEHRPDTIAYVLEKMNGAPGIDWLERRYFVTAQELRVAGSIR